MGMDTIWTVRGVNEPYSKQGLSQGDGEVRIYDPDLSPDWLKLPHDQSLPKELQGKAVQVQKSLWFPVAPDPETWDREDWQWEHKKTRWHILDAAIEDHQIAVAEVDGIGWCLFAMNPGRLAVMLMYAEFHENGEHDEVD